MKKNNLNELSKEEEEDILAKTDDIEIFDDELAQPVPKQDHITKKAAYKKLGLKGNSSKFNPPSNTGLLPTPSIPSFIRSSYNPAHSLSISSLPGPSGLASHPPFSSASSTIYASNTPTSILPRTISSATPIPSSLLPSPLLFYTPSLPRSSLTIRPVTSTAVAPTIETLPLPLPQSFVADLSRHYSSLFYHQNKESFFSRSADSGYFPPFTLSRFTSDFTKGLSHNLGVKYHEAVANLRKEICSIMTDHHRILQQEETVRITSLTDNLQNLHEPEIVRIITDNAKRTAYNKNDNRRGNRE